MGRACDWVAWPVVALVLLLACDHCYAVHSPAPGICLSIDIRNNAHQMEKLRECRVIEGHLSIVLIEKATAASFENVSFPELREVTGYVLIYRLGGVRNLGDLFPNLSVIRGMQLFKDFALVVFDNEGLTALGLRSLSRIERGAVRIQNNDHLCYANTIDWSRIIAEGPENNIIRDNYDIRLCDLCPNAQSRLEDHRHPHLQCPADSTGRLLCWDNKHCQKRECPAHCNGRACTDNGTCCHSTCLGGCDGPTSSDCHVCANFSFRYGKERTCMEHCPANTYELARRCVTEEECRNMTPPHSLGNDQKSNSEKRYKIFNNRSCIFTCPSGYTEVGEGNNSRCVPCGERGCRRECPGGKIDSVAAAESFRGCTHIKGTLDIAMRAISGNSMAVLEATLGEIREIEGSLRIVRSQPLVSLMFLRNLEKIGGHGMNKGQSLYIFNNQNLEMLWNWTVHKPIEITTGRLFIHFNPKLCYDNILPLKNMTKDPQSTFSVTEVSQDNNGDQGSCYKDTLHLNVSQLGQRSAILTWNMYCLEDTRKLLGYSIYYIPAEHNVTLYGQRDACSDTWNVQDYSMEETKNSTQLAVKNSADILTNPCTDMQPLFYLLTQLSPYTRYAAYVKTYTTQQDKKGAQSAIIYFRTLPERPSPPLGLTADNLKEHSATIRWLPPSMPNGTIINYHFEIQANAYNRPKILTGNINYCANPNAIGNMIAGRWDDRADRGEERGSGVTERGSAGGREGEGDGTCACASTPRPAVRFNQLAEAERIETINFENDLQNYVYIKNIPTSNETASSRMRRSVRNKIESMLVILSENHDPTIGKKYSNTTDGEYAKTLYYDLDGSQRSLAVTKLRHFTWYTVYVWACRNRHPNETLLDYEQYWCSRRVHYTFRTLERVDADVVKNVNADVLSVNKTQPEMNVTWLPPDDPNGFIVAYNVYLSRVEDNNQEIGLGNCITAEDYEGKGGILFTKLVPGNYSIRVTPVSVRGVGNVSTDIYVLIPERSAGGAGWAWGAGAALAVLLALLAAAAAYARRALLPPAGATKMYVSVNPEYTASTYVADEWEVPRANIEFGRELGQGSFGMVYEGIARNIHKDKPEIRCAVKTVNQHATDRERLEFLKEASVMKAFDTFHVVRLLGVVSRGQPTLVVMELMELGDLKSYLRSHRPDAEHAPEHPPQPPTLQNILQMAIEIADGMAYLSGKKYVHRDLAARNCMVAGDLTVKVGDFGMTRDIYETDYYRKGTKGLMPVRWMSPESLKDGVFSSASDVWSYGVVLWEMATLAMQPYQGLSNEQVVRYVVEGGVMERPEHCPDRLYELMRACWSHRAQARPSFLQLVADLAPTAAPYFRHRSYFHSPAGQEGYALQTSAADEELASAGMATEALPVGAVGSGSGANLFDVSGRLVSWVRELSLRREPADAAAEPLQPLGSRPAAIKGPPNGLLRDVPPC